MGQLTTHVLDTANGCTGSGIAVQLFRVTRAREALVKCVTNADGRCDQPLLTGDAFTAGNYELVFGVGQYFSDQGNQVADPPFLDEVVIRFGIADVDQHYHVPLLVSPWSYSTYRGS